MFLRRLFALLVPLAFAGAQAPADNAVPVAANRPVANTDALLAEETYELRLERFLNQKGPRALVTFLEREVKENPRAYAKAWLANYLLYGAELGTPELANPPRGFMLANESAMEGSLFGRELLGRAWGDGRGAPVVDAHQATVELQEAADRGRNSAMAELGKFYFFGAGVTKDRQIAERWIRQAAQRGAVGGMQYLAGWYENAAHVDKPDRAKANAFYYEAAEYGSTEARRLLRERAAAGDESAQKYVHLDFIVSAIEGSNPLPAKLRATVKWLREHAAEDDWPVQLALAEVMMEKRSVAYDLEGATTRLERAVAAGNRDAQYLQGRLAWYGIGRKKDEAEAVRLWTELANGGNARALNQIGWLHWWGNGEKYGVVKDATKAFDFCRRSADLGYWSGQLNLADCFAHGIGTPVNYYLAGKYYGILDRRGFVRGREMKERVLSYVKD